MGATLVNVTLIIVPLSLVSEDELNVTAPDGFQLGCRSPGGEKSRRRWRH